jgi:hypothetical protein
MDHIITPTVQAVALRVRKWAELQSIESRMPANLEGMCARASAELFRRLSAVGVRAELHAYEDGYGAAHVYTVVEDIVLDVTATQFSKLRKHPVFTMHLREAEAMYPWYVSCEVFHTITDLVKWQKKTEFPANQVAR